MEKKPYETPEIRSLGSVQDLTELVVDCNASVEIDYTCEDGLCCIEQPR
jgi:hypothetical protein